MKETQKNTLRNISKNITPIQQHTLVKICRSLYVDAYDCGMYVPPLVVIPFPSDMVEALVLLAKAPIVFPNVPEKSKERAKWAFALEKTKEIFKRKKNIQRKQHQFQKTFQKIFQTRVIDVLNSGGSMWTATSPLAFKYNAPGPRKLSTL